MAPCSRPAPACSNTACIRPVARVYPAAMSTASVSCHTSRSLGPLFFRWIWSAIASHTGAHSVPGEDRMYSTPSLRNASTRAEPPSNWFFMVGLLKGVSCRVYYLTAEHARPLAGRRDQFLEQHCQATKEVFVLVHARP